MPATLHTASQTRRLALLALASLPLGLSLPLRAIASETPLRIGLTPVFLDDRVGVLERWRRYIEVRMDRPVQFVQRGSYRDVLRLVVDGDTDLAWLCGFPYWRNRDRLKLVATPVFRGEPLYRAYLIRNHEHVEIDSLETLRGQVFAYADPDSNSGFLYVQHRLRQAGQIPAEFFGRTFFTWGHRRVVEAVAVNLAQGGAVDGYVWEALAQTHPELTSATRIIEQSPPFGFPPIVASSRLPPVDLAAARALLLGMHDDAEGRELLNLLVLDGFTLAPPSLYDSIGAMADAP